MTTLSIYFSSYCGYCIINYLTWNVNKMKKRNHGSMYSSFGSCNRLVSGYSFCRYCNI